MLDRAAAAATPTPTTAPLTRIRAGSRDDAKKLRATLQQLLATRRLQGEYLERLVDAARSKGVHLLLEDARGVPFSSWERFCVERQPWGLGISAEAVELIIKERSDPRVQARRLLRADAPGPLLLGRQSARRAGDPATAGTKGPPPGTGRAYWLARLRRDRVDLLRRVEAGELSPLAAAVEAGWTTRLIWCRQTPESFAAQAVTHLSGEQLVALTAYLRTPATIPHPMDRRRQTQQEIGGPTDAA